MQSGAPLPLGHLLDGRYCIQKVLGVGGMGRVYLANDTRLANRPVAAKEMMLGDGAQERKAIEDFNREARVLARLSHPSIPQVIDYFAEHGRHYLVMEYVAGGDLQSRLERMGPGSRLPEAQVLLMARQLLEVLQFLHSQNPPIIYRDLKPANIMIDEQGRAMLVDFGIARFLPTGGRGTQIGSVGYAPPEQYLGKMEPRSDLYALAATMHHLLTGRDPQLEPPFSFPPIAQLAPDVSAQTAKVLMNALETDINLRPASARAMRDLLPEPSPDQPWHPPAGMETASAAANAGGKARSIAQVKAPVPDQPLSRAPTPRSLPAAPIASAGMSRPKASVQSSPGAKPSLIAGDKDRAEPLIPRLKASSQMKTQRRSSFLARQKPASGYTSSTARTTDLGLKIKQSLAPSGTPALPHLVQKNAAPLTPPEASLSGKRPAASRRHPVSPISSATSASVPLTSNGQAAPALTGTEITGARLVSVTEGVQFGLSGSRLVLGRARSEERRVGKECRSRWAPYD